MSWIHPLHAGCSQVSCLAHWRVQFIFLPLLSSVPEETLLVTPHVPSQVQLQLLLGFPEPIPALSGRIPVISPRRVSLPSLPVHFPVVC